MNGGPSADIGRGTGRAVARPSFLLRREPAVAWHALDVAELATWLLASSDARMLCIGCDLTKTDAQSPVICWRSSGSIRRAADASSGDKREFTSVAGALRCSARSLADMLSERWPSYAPVRRLGIVTDGAGVGFSPDDPWPLAPGWMSRQLGGSTGLTQVIPFAGLDPWAAFDRPAAGTG